MSQITKTDSYFCFNNIPNSVINTKCKIIGFDLDYTIIKPASGKKFSKDENDWKFMFKSTDIVINKLQNIANDKDGEINYIIFILTNQNVKDTHKSFNKCKNVYLNLLQKIKNINLIMFGAMLDDYNRKPRLGSLSYLSRLVKFNKSEMLYVGDACGRKADFSDTDLKFALNAGCKFKTPESFFLENKEKIIMPKCLFKDINVEDVDILCDNIFRLFKTKVKVIVFIGAPASGKTYLSKKLIDKNLNSGIIISQDNLKTFAKCEKEFHKNIYTNNLIIVDNTNRDKNTRNKWIKIFDKYNNDSYCLEFKFIYLKSNKEKSLHCLAYRNYKRALDNKPTMSKMSVNMFYAKFENPDINEFGKDNLVIIDKFIERFRPNMNVEDYTEFCLHWT